MRLLIVGSLRGHLADAGKIALERGVKVAQAEGETEALRALRSGHGADLVLIDVALNIARFLGDLKRERITTPVVACGLADDKKRAVEAIKAGAQEYMPLPPDSKVIAAILAAVGEETTTFTTHNEDMKKVIALADQVATSNASVLICGESGTGKEVMARYLHEHSPRNARPLISLNCAAIPESLLESELFGHEKGAFTGAAARRIGKFEEANSSTLLLDEISEMAPHLQAKLLRAIQERRFDRLGGNQAVEIDIRVLATSNRNLEREVQEGRFREDLFFRLNVVVLTLPPLRARADDLFVLAEHFLNKYAQANGLPKPGLSHKAREVMMRHSWPGNVRELENCMHRAVLLAQNGEAQEENLLLHPQVSKTAPDEHTNSSHAFIGRKVCDVEREMILGTLDHCFGNRTHAANLLGISIRTLRNKLHSYATEGIPAPSTGPGRA